MGHSGNGARRRAGAGFGGLGDVAVVFGPRPGIELDWLKNGVHTARA